MQQWYGICPVVTHKALFSMFVWISLSLSLSLFCEIHLRKAVVLHPVELSRKWRREWPSSKLSVGETGGEGRTFSTPPRGLSCPQAAKETENGKIIIIIVGLGLIIFPGNSLRTPIWEIVFAITGDIVPYILL